MKPANSSNTGARLTCQVIRFWSSVRRDGASPSSHLKSCESCQCFFVAMDQLQVSLRQAAQPTSAPPPGIEQRIFKALDALEAPAHRNVGRRITALSMAGGLAAIALAAAWHFNASSFPGHSTETAVDYSPDVAALVAAVRSMPADLKSNLEAPTAQLVRDNSLGREVENVYSDAKSALDFLAANFLPAS